MCNTYTLISQKNDLELIRFTLNQFYIVFLKKDWWKQLIKRIYLQWNHLAGFYICVLTSDLHIEDFRAA